MEVRYKKLFQQKDRFGSVIPNSGEWGLEIKGDEVCEGEIVEFQKANGQLVHAVVGRIVFEKDGYTLARLGRELENYSELVNREDFSEREEAHRASQRTTPASYYVNNDGKLTKALIAFAEATDHELYKHDVHGGSWSVRAIQTQASLEQYAQAASEYHVCSPIQKGEIAGFPFIAFHDVQRSPEEAHRQLSVIDLGAARLVLDADLGQYLFKEKERSVQEQAQTLSKGQQRKMQKHERNFER